MHELLDHLRSNLPMFLENAEDQLAPIVVRRQHRVGIIRKKWVEERKAWAGWELLSWKFFWKDTGKWARLYFLTSGKLLATGETFALEAYEVDDDFLVDVLLNEGRAIANLNSSVANLYEHVQMRTPGIPQEWPGGASALHDCFQAAGIERLRYIFDIHERMYPD